MTDEQINTAIAEACGWSDFIMHQEFGLMGVAPDTHGLRTAVDWYTCDLNAMHEAEQTLSPKEFVTYIEEVMKLYYEPMRAAARQRAEAFLRTLGKWEEAE